MKEYKNITLKHEIKDDDKKALVMRYIDSDFNNDEAFKFGAEKGWTQRMVTGYLVSQGIYRKTQKVEEVTEPKVSKKDIVGELEGVLGIDLSGLYGAKKEALEAILTYIKSK